LGIGPNPQSPIPNYLNKPLNNIQHRNLFKDIKIIKLELIEFRLFKEFLGF
jgi:hypothetical protein